MSKILCIGEALIDMICIDKGKTLSEGNNFLKKSGGAPTNVAAAIAALAILGDVRHGDLLVLVADEQGYRVCTMVRSQACRR